MNSFLILIFYVLYVHEEAPQEDSLSGGAALDGKIPFPLMTKAERFIRCRAQRHGCRGSDGHRESMSDMTSILRDMTLVFH